MTSGCILVGPRNKAPPNVERYALIECIAHIPTDSRLYLGEHRLGAKHARQLTVMLRRFAGPPLAASPATFTHTLKSSTLATTCSSATSQFFLQSYQRQNCAPNRIEAPITLKLLDFCMPKVPRDYVLLSHHQQIEQRWSVLQTQSSYDCSGSGKVNLKWAPECSPLISATSPPCRRMTCWTRSSPSPAPRPSREPRWKASKIRF